MFAMLYTLCVRINFEQMLIIKSDFFFPSSYPWIQCDIHIDEHFCTFTGCKRTVLFLQYYLFMIDFPPSFILISMVYLRTLLFAWTEFMGTTP